MEVPISSRGEREALTPFRRILVSIDGSDASIRAANTAIQMAAVHGLPVIALYVVDDRAVEEVVTVSGEAPDTVRRQLESKGWRYLEHVARLAKNYAVACERLVRKGRPYSQIADLVRSRHVDLVVVGESRVQSARRALVGGLTDHVIEHTPCSVLVVKSD